MHFSSRVRLRLERGNEVINLAQVAPDAIMMAEPSEMSAGEVTVIVQINGIDYPRQVILPDGISRQDRWVAIDAVDEFVSRDGVSW